MSNDFFKKKPLAELMSYSQANISVAKKKPEIKDENYVPSQKQIKQWEQLAKKGDKVAQFNLGICYYLGKGIPQNLKKAVEWFQKAAIQGIAQAQLSLAICYQEGKGIAQDLKKAVEWYKKAATQGFAPAQTSLGFCYEKGEGIAQDLKKAFEWFQKAATQGFAPAQFFLAIYYQEGKGIVQDLEKAVEWFQKAAIQEVALAQLSLAVCYEHGKGIAQDLEKAVEWYQKAAIQGLAPAQFNLAVYYERGNGVVQDLEKAFEWYQKAAIQGDAKAQTNLGFCYEKGKGIAQNLEKAVEWYQKAASQDYAQAQFNLALCYEKGEGVAQDLEKAEYWYSKAINDPTIALMIERENQKEKEKADKEMLSFLTHTLNNSLGSVGGAIKIIIRELGTDYEKDPQKFKAVLRMQALATTFSVNQQLIQMFKQYINDPADFQEAWKKDNVGDFSIEHVLDFSLQQTFNRLFFQLSNNYLTKFIPALTDEQCNNLRQNFIREVVIEPSKKTSECIDWLKNNFPILELEIEKHDIYFEKNNKRFTFLFSIFAELIFNALRYAINQPVKIKWYKQTEFYCFTCINDFDATNRYVEHNSRKGLIFIKRLLTLLIKSELVSDESKQIFTITLKIHEDNFK